MLRMTVLSRLLLPPDGIRISFRPLSEPAERQLLAWATWTGAAVLLEADRAAGPASAVGARPTLFHGDAEDLAVLSRAVSGRRLRWPGRPSLPFGRLHTILLDGDLTTEDRAFWESRGVRLLAPPPLVPAAAGPAGADLAIRFVYPGRGRLGGTEWRWL